MSQEAATRLRWDNRVMPQAQPLAARMRPRDLDEFVGQSHLVGKGRVLRKAMEAGQLPSMILWGPPGTGKTTLAAIGAKRTQSRFVAISAVASGVAELRKIIDESRKLRGLTNQGTVLFIDEIHRFNKAQQDVVLPYVENGDVTLLGATTENPSFEVNSALLSRSRVFTLKPLTEDEVRLIIERALSDERGLGDSVALTKEALDGLQGIDSAPRDLPDGATKAYHERRDCLVKPLLNPPAQLSGRICGNSSTSRIEGESVRNMTRRSMPRPTPAVGGRPYSNARI